MSSILDKNKIFFALIHYILSEQKNVNWILKTSLIDFTGISSLLEEKPYKTESILDDVVDYVISVKPYHVQFSHYFEHYQTQSEDVIIPGNDWIEPTHMLTFDNISPYPNVKDIIIITKDMTPEEEQNIIDDLTDGIYYFYYEKDPMENKTGLYNIERVTGIDSIGQEIVVVERTKVDYKEFINESLANRVFYSKMTKYGISAGTRKGIYDSKDKIFDEIKKDINANFKGLEINGSVFDIGNFGYDIFDYDTEDYDSPTVIYDYYITSKDCPELDETGEIFYIDPEERVYTVPQYTTCDKQRFSISNELQPMSDSEINELYIVSPSGVMTLYPSAEFGYDNSTGNYVDIFRNIKLNEKLIAIKRERDLRPEDNKVVVMYADVFVGVMFKESDSETLKRQFVTYDPEGMEMAVPISIGSSDKIAIQLRDLTDSRNDLLPTDYEMGSGFIVVHGNAVQPGEHIIITTFDYKYLYDKIYTWEDKYGLSNNIVNLYGDKFMRARYESDRPSELVVSNPQSAVTFYKEEGINYDILMSDWKNEMFYTKNLLSALTKVTNVELKPDTLDEIVSLTFENANNFEDAPGKVMINGEIIKYGEIDKGTHTISNLERGIDGTPINGGYLPRYMPDRRTTIMAGDDALPYRESDWGEYDKNNVYKSYQVEYLNQNQFICPTGYKIGSKVYITKNKKINLMEDVYYTSSKIILDSCNIISPEEQEAVYVAAGSSVKGDWTLKINTDYVRFTKISMNSAGLFELSGLTFIDKYAEELEPIYLKDKALIYSSIPEDILPTDYDVEIVEGDSSLKIVSSGNQKKYVYVPVDNVWKDMSGISCTDNYLFFVVPEDSIIDGVIQNASYEVYDSTTQNKVTVNNQDTGDQDKPVETLISNEDWYLMFRDDGHSAHIRQTEEYSTVHRQTKIIYEAGTYDAYGYTDTGGKVFKITGCKVSADGEITKYGPLVYHRSMTYDEIEHEWKENYDKQFGIIKKNNVYRADGSLYAKVMDNKMILIMVQVTINTDNVKLEKGESVNITIVDKENTDSGKTHLDQYEFAEL